MHCGFFVICVPGFSIPGFSILAFRVKVFRCSSIPPFLVSVLANHGHPHDLKSGALPMGSQYSASNVYNYHYYPPEN